MSASELMRVSECELVQVSVSAREGVRASASECE